MSSLLLPPPPPLLSLRPRAPPPHSPSSSSISPLPLPAPPPTAISTAAPPSRSSAGTKRRAALSASPSVGTSRATTSPSASMSSASPTASSPCSTPAASVAPSPSTLSGMSRSCHAPRRRRLSPPVSLSFMSPMELACVHELPSLQELGKTGPSENQVCKYYIIASEDFLDPPEYVAEQRLLRGEMSTEFVAAKVPGVQESTIKNNPRGGWQLEHSAKQKMILVMIITCINMLLEYKAGPSEIEACNGEDEDGVEDDEGEAHLVARAQSRTQRD